MMENSTSTVNIPPTDENYWQLKKTIAECNRYMFEEQVACDITFSIEHETCEKKEITAHKFILISRSPVFYTMFCGSLASPSEKVVVTDCEPAAFELMLEFMYTAEVELTQDIVMAVIYASKKYMVPGLVDECKRFLAKSIKSSNVCFILDQAVVLGEDDLVKRCMVYIQQNTLKVLKSHTLKRMSEKGLAEILKNNELTCKEVDIFQACNSWAEAKCEKEKQHVTSTNKRQWLLKENILRLIRFSAMNGQEFADYVSITNVLTGDETTTLLQQISCHKIPQAEFSSEVRQPIETLNVSMQKRFMHVEDDIEQDDMYRYPIKITDDIIIHGFQVYNSNPPGFINEIVIDIVNGDQEIACWTFTDTDLSWISKDKLIYITLSTPFTLLKSVAEIFGLGIGYESYSVPNLKITGGTFERPNLGLLTFVNDKSKSHCYFSSLSYKKMEG